MFTGNHAPILRYFISKGQSYKGILRVLQDKSMLMEGTLLIELQSQWCLFSLILESRFLCPVAEVVTSVFLMRVLGYFAKLFFRIYKVNFVKILFITICE